MASFLKKNKNEAVEPELSTAIVPIPKARAVDLDMIKVTQDVLLLIPEHIALANHMLPLYLTNGGNVLVDRKSVV